MKYAYGLALALFTLLMASPMVAQAWHHYPPHHYHPGHHHWHGGYWHHGWHGGRMGWWWVVNGSWFWYPAAIYPRPHYVSPVVVESAPPVVVQPAQPMVVQPQTAAPATQYWYFCEESNAYYPYVSTCPGGWKTVPANPAGPAK